MGNGASIDNTEEITEQSPLLATYELLPGYQWSETHSCFASGRYNLENIPEPTPPSNRKSDIFDEVKYAEVDEKAFQIPRVYLKKPLPTLARYLTKDYSDALSKVRVIFRWITAQPLEQLDIPETEPHHATTLFQLWRLKYQKGNYAQLFSLLCSFAQITSVIINGKLKGSSYEVGDPLDAAKHYGEWNAVLIDGYWRLINVFWGTCAESSGDIGTGDKCLVYCCDENYFLTDPDQFICTHFPEKEKWQLLSKPITESEFLRNALLKDRFFNLNLILNYPNKCIIYPKDEARISFELPRENQSNLRFFAILSEDRKVQEWQRYVFIERLEQREIRVRVRSPGNGVFKLEIVGKDDKIQDANYSFDWVAIYRIIFKEQAHVPFPECPLIGWGPGSQAMFECGLAPVSHFQGEIDTETGSFEVKFVKKHGFKMKYWGELKKNEINLTPVPNNMVYRIEENNVLFNIETPTSGEYALAIHATDDEGIVTNVCNYMVVSEQSKNNLQFPMDLQDGLGAKDAFHEIGIKCLSPQSAFLVSDTQEMTFEFKKPPHVELSALLTDDQSIPDSSKAKLRAKLKDDTITYIVKLKKTGNYGFRLKAIRTQSTLSESVYDAVIKFTSVKKRKVKNDREDDIQEEDLKELPNEIRNRIQEAILKENDTELEHIIHDIRSLRLMSKEEEIKNIKFEISVIRCRRELLASIETRHSTKMEVALQNAKKRGCTLRLATEIAALKSMLLVERNQKIERLVSDVQSLNQRAISEIRSYTNPPPVVHNVMKATLLLLGYPKEETQDWIKVQVILGGTVRQSIIRKASKLKLDEIKLGVALGAKKFLQDITVDDIRQISAGAATFYHWVKGVTEEIQKRNSGENEPEDVAQDQQKQGLDSLNEEVIQKTNPREIIDNEPEDVAQDQQKQGLDSLNEEVIQKTNPKEVIDNKPEDVAQDQQKLGLDSLNEEVIQKTNPREIIDNELEKVIQKTNPGEIFDNEPEDVTQDQLEKGSDCLNGEVVQKKSPGEIIDSELEDVMQDTNPGEIFDNEPEYVAQDQLKKESDCLNGEVVEKKNPGEIIDDELEDFDQD